MSYVYIVRCADDTFYTGYTTDVPKRVQTHNLGKGAKYTRSRLPVALVYYEELPTKNAALCREAHIKRLKRADKQLLLISHDNMLIFVPKSDMIHNN